MMFLRVCDTAREVHRLIASLVAEWGWLRRTIEHTLQCNIANDDSISKCMKANTCGMLILKISKRVSIRYNHLKLDYLD